MAIPELNSVIQQKVEVAPGLSIIRVSPLNWILPPFKAGQFTVLGLLPESPRFQYSDKEEMIPDPSKLILRAYSIASSSLEKQYIEFYIRLVNSGSLTPRIFALNIDDKIWMSPKFTGMFTISEIPRDQNIIFFGTGTGLAPYMSMLRSDLVCNENRKYAVVHGARNSWDLGYRSELLTIERLCQNFTYINTISLPENEPMQWNGFTGHVEDIWKNGILQECWKIDITPENTHMFLCGHPIMIMNMMNSLEKENFKEHKKNAPGKIHLEKYW
ncbi:MAG TPA: ferredoxin--NADP reductase [Ignavibacteria bacterium]